jgi:acetyl-CoA synthetase
MAGASPMKPGSAAFPFFGVELAVFDPKTGAKLTGNKIEGHLAITSPWPGIARCACT